MSFAQSQAETEKWIVETLQKNSVTYRTKRNVGDNKSAGSSSHVTYDHFTFTFDKQYFIIRCDMIGVGDTARGAALPTEIRIPIYDLQSVFEDLSYSIDERYYRLAFQTQNKTIKFQVLYGRDQNDFRNYYSIRLARTTNDKLIEQLRKAFFRIKPLYSKP